MTSGILAAESKLTPSAGQAGGFEMDEFVLGIADVEYHATGSEGGAKLFDDGLDERVLTAGLPRQRTSPRRREWFRECLARSDCRRRWR